jgi:hypothetical protein
MTYSFGQANQFSHWPRIVVQVRTPTIGAVFANKTDTLRQSIGGTVQYDPSCSGSDVGNNFRCAPLVYEDNQYQSVRKENKCEHTIFTEPDADPGEAGRSAVASHSEIISEIA